MRELKYRKMKNNVPKMIVNNLLRLDVKKNIVSKPVLLGFIIGFASHLLLDVLTYRSVQLFYPREKGVSLKICKSKSAINTVIMIFGYIWLIAVCVLYYQHFLVLLPKRG